MRVRLYIIYVYYNIVCINYGNFITIYTLVIGVLDCYALSFYALLLCYNNIRLWESCATKFPLNFSVPTQDPSTTRFNPNHILLLWAKYDRRIILYYYAYVIPLDVCDVHINIQFFCIFFFRTCSLSEAAVFSLPITIVR